jgi:MFS family permease
VGSQLTVVAIFYQVYLLTGSSLAVGLVSLAQLAPALVGSLLGGSVADAVDRRRMLVVTQLALALCSVGLALNSLGGKPSLWPIYVLAAVGAGFAGADMPGRVAIMMNLVPHDSFTAANVLRQLEGQIALVLGPAFGGLLLASFSVATVYWLDVASFAAAIAAATKSLIRRRGCEAGGNLNSFSGSNRGVFFSYHRAMASMIRSEPWPSP